MERLTIPDVRVDEHTTQRAFIDAEAVREHAMEFYWRLKAYEDRGCEPEEVLPKDKADEIALKLMRLADLESLCSYDRLRELAEADKDGRVVVRPCKVGDVVWFKTYKNNARDCIGIQPHEVTRISASIIVSGEIVDIGIPVDQIGVSVFLSEAEAVAADAKPPAGNAILEV